MKKNGAKIILVAAAAVLLSVMLLAPRLPEKVQQKTTGVEAKISKAVALVQGENPMEGITMLREIVAEDPKNTEANFQLGLFSMQSKQFDKAVNRFETVTAKQDTNYNLAWFYLGQAQAEIGNKSDAIKALNRFKQLNHDTALNNNVDHFIKQLLNN